MKPIARASGLILAWIIAPSPAFAQNDVFSFMEDYFRKNEIRGTVVVENLLGSKRYVHGADGVDRRFLPASTFKIPNTLIALAEGAVANGEEIIHWDGKDKGLAEWNADHSIKTAMPSSCVWFYQELARRVGDLAYLEQLAVLGYGNGKTGPKLDSFWLDGDLRISPAEQIAFLKRVYREEFPYKREHYALLKEAMVVKRTKTYILRAKTGWTMRVKPQIGWYVGWLEVQGETWFFVVRIDIDSDRDAPFREKTALRALEGLGLIR